MVSGHVVDLAQAFGMCDGESSAFLLSSKSPESANPVQNKYFTKFSKASQMLWGDS